jgi:hypothetical protein
MLPRPQQLFNMDPIVVLLTLQLVAVGASTAVNVMGFRTLRDRLDRLTPVLDSIDTRLRHVEEALQVRSRMTSNSSAAADAAAAAAAREAAAAAADEEEGARRRGARLPRGGNR